MNARPIARNNFLVSGKSNGAQTRTYRRGAQRALPSRVRQVEREKNREAIRERSRALSAIPSVAQQLSLYRKVLYAVKRQALLDAGYTPNPVGRPRVRRLSDGIVFPHKKAAHDGTEGTTGPDAHLSQVGSGQPGALS